MQKIIVNYKKQGATIHTFFKPMPTPENPMNGVNVRLVTGINHFEAEFFESLKKHPQVQAMFDNDELEIIEADVKLSKEEASTDKAVQGLAAFSEKKSISLIKKTFDRDQLKTWLDHEARSLVRRALEEQIEVCTPKKKEK